MSITLDKRLLTVDEYHKMGEVGILQEKGIELINGEIIIMSPIGSKHSAHVNKITAIFNNLLIGKAIISSQNPVIIDGHSEPEPDIAILKYHGDFYEEQHPRAEDVLLIIEVALSSLDYDRNIKLPLYAEAGIPEVWIFNLQSNVVEIYTSPKEKYYTHNELKFKGETIFLKSFNLNIDVDKM